MARHSFSGARGLMRAVSALSLCAATAGCESAAILADAAFAGCGTSTAYLSGWYANLPAQSQIDADPFGGYVFAYWIDDLGNACSGDPGRNGEVGPAVIPAQTPAARAAIAANAPITPDQLSAFQEIPVPYANYSATGLHFVQFYSTAHRLRSDGSIWTTQSDGIFGATAVTDIGQGSCLRPVAFKVNQTLFLPPNPTSGAQDPARCRIKAMPATAAMSQQELQAFHVVDLPHGLAVHNIPQ
jgi:hypothetical protein